MAESGLYSLISAECNGVSASEDDGLSAIEIRGVSSSLSCISCGCGVSTIEVGGLSSLSTCIGCAPPHLWCFSRASCRLISHQIS